MDFEIILQKIIDKGGLTKEEADKRIVDKQSELSNLISKEGAAYIIAKEMGIELFPQKAQTQRRLEIKNILPKIRNPKTTNHEFSIQRAPRPKLTLPTDAGQAK